MGSAMFNPMFTLGTVHFSATDRRPTGEAGRPVKRASQPSLLELRVTGFGRLPASFGIKFKRAARGAVSRLICRPVSGDQKTGAGLPARAAFIASAWGLDSPPAVSGGGAHLLPRLAAAPMIGRVS